MLSFEETRAALLAAAQSVMDRERVDLLAAGGRVLAAPVLAPLDVPPADNSAMDGYAVRASEIVAGKVLPVSQRIPAGSVPAALQPGSVARIFTGAMIPPGADAVVMQENSETTDDGVRFTGAPGAGDNIRRAGEDIARGSAILSVGDKLAPVQLGLLASVGIAEVEVFRRLRVAVFFTGDELLSPGESLAPGKIFNSNRYVLRPLLEQMGCEVQDLGIVRDSLDATRAALQRAAQSCDVVMTCGGVSVGEEDHVKAAVEAEGCLQSWKVAIKPGKPLAFGRVGNAAFIGLPGNPVSAFVTFRMLVQPFLQRMQGRSLVEPATMQMRADFEWNKEIPVREFLRVRRNAEGGLDRFANQGSGVLTSCVWADGLVSNPPQTRIQHGDMVYYLPFGEL